MRYVLKISLTVEFTNLTISLKVRKNHINDSTQKNNRITFRKCKTSTQL